MECFGWESDMTDDNFDVTMRGVNEGLNRRITQIAFSCPGVKTTSTLQWMWYCATHDSHGTAVDMDEAMYVAASHRIHWDRYYDFDIEGTEHFCDVYVLERKRRPGRPATRKRAGKGKG